MATTVQVRAPYEPAMSFEEIAKALGVSYNDVWLCYRSAMRKIAARPQSLKQLAQAVAEAQANRQVGNLVYREAVR